VSAEKSILTYKVKHGRDFTAELAKAFKVAEYAVRNKHIKNLSSSMVKHIGLKSVISCQILRKYGRCKTIKKVRNVKLIIPGQAVKLKGDIVYISSLKLEINFAYQKDLITKINQIELDNEYVYVSCEVKPRYE
jgi:putative transposase